MKKFDKTSLNVAVVEDTTKEGKKYKYLALYIPFNGEEVEKRLFLDPLEYMAIELYIAQNQNKHNK